ncbi:MAG: FAD-binding oxidoreductase [Thermoplasmatota archaeon]
MPLEESVKARIIEVVGRENASDDTATRYIYGSDASIHHHMPDIVVRPESARQVQELVRICNEKRIPVVVRGAGTGLSGQVVPVQGGVLMDMMRMSRILAIRIEDLYVEVEPGVVFAKLNEALAPHGYWFPPAPGSGDVCTIGGMIGNSASGIRTIKYGATRDLVMGLEVVLADGTLIEVGNRTVKNASGYQLEKLFVGSEGTLGIVTKARLRILPKPKSSGSLIASFASLGAAGAAISQVYKNRLMPSALEIMDTNCIQAVKKAFGTPLPDAAAIIIIEMDGDPRVVEEDLRAAGEICRAAGAQNIDYATDPAKIAMIWESRKSVLPAMARSGERGPISLADDMGIPISRVSEVIGHFPDIARKHNIVIGAYGHAGEGNIHGKVLLNLKSKREWEAGRRATDEIYETVLRAGGTMSAEHGIGITRARLFKTERGPAVEVMRKIKRALDPNNILNPGKIFDAPDDMYSFNRYVIEESE